MGDRVHASSLLQLLCDLSLPFQTVAIHKHVLLGNFFVRPVLGWHFQLKERHGKILPGAVWPVQR